MSDPFWFKKPEVLYSNQNLLQFWPSKYQTYEERINSMTRFILYAGITMSFYKHDTNPLVMSILLVAVLVVISNSKNKIIQKLIKTNTDCQEPTNQNPLGNRLPYDYEFRKKACNSYDVNNNISNSLFAEFPTKGLSEMNKDYIERQFFSMPNTDLINDQVGFASWLYGAPNKKMCKSNPEYCTGSEGRQNASGK